MEPSPYSIENEPLFFVLVDEDDALYCVFFLHVELVQLLDGTHRSDEPVSKSIKNFCAGVPMEILPAHSVSLSSSVSDSLCRLVRLAWMCSGRTATGLISAPALKACVPTFFSRLIRFCRCLLGEAE